jgi:TPR repeat protein
MYGFQAFFYDEGAVAVGMRAAMTKLGIGFESGRGVIRNRARALTWYQRGANAGDPETQRHPFVSLRYCVGCPTSPIQSVNSDRRSRY